MTSISSFDANSVFTVGRKRKAEDDEDYSHSRRSPSLDSDRHMNTSPEPAHRVIKRARANVTGRALPLSRILEPMDTHSVKTLLQNLCDRHPELLAEVSSLAPRPTVQSALSTLHNYETNLRNTFPHGGDHAGDYAFNRVRPVLMELLDALLDYTQHFLPPQESQWSTSMAFLDGATDLIHRLPEWSTPQNNLHKQMAYEEMSKAWMLVIGEAAKKGAGVAMQYGGWDRKVVQHNDRSGNRMQGVLQEMRNAVPPSDNENSNRAKELLGFRNQAFGIPVPVRTW
jgi:protein Cut8